MKQQPLGICDLCLGPIPEEDWYTRRGPRLYCSVDCKNTANSRAGSPIRTRKIHERMEAGRWQNPRELHPPDPERIGLGVSRTWKARVRAGTWRNPALSPAARAKLSRPRRHAGALASAIERLCAGARVSDLAPEEQAAHRTYRRAQVAALRARQTPEQIERRREQYRRSWRKRNQKPQGT